jgi:glycosyltransferase involved in cell wall biosynthesis
VIDLLYLTHNRLEFTWETIRALRQNTDWSQVRRVHLYDDGSTDGTKEFLESVRLPADTRFCTGRTWGGPVAVMNDAIRLIGKNAILAKIDSDTMVPPDWLNESLVVMDRNPELHLLGIEAMQQFPVERNCEGRGIVPARYIGGIGLMRTSAFQTLPEPDGRFGFTAWQDNRPEVKKAWLNPVLPVCLLDRMPIEPWRSISDGYNRKKWQRPWKPYEMDQSALWEWFA